MFKSHRVSRVVFTIALALMTLGADALFTQGRQPARNRGTVMLDGREVVEGEVIVRYRALTGQIERERAEFQADSEASEAIGRRGARRMSSRVLTTRQMLERLRANPDVEFVEPNYIIRASAVPNDSSMGQLWGLLNTGQTIDGTAGVPGADIGAAAAWDMTTGSRANVVAIFDTGIDFSHPDLAANVFSAPSQYSVTIGATTVTCAAGTHGFNALTNTCIPNDDNGHGTHVAGIIGAVGNNNRGVTGVNWIANLMAIKVLGADGNGTTADAIKGIDFVIKAKAALGAAANVRVLNASWGGAAFSSALNDAIAEANSADMLFVASAGSDSSNNDTVPHHPASSTSANVLSVAAVDNRGVLASFSNYGANSVHLAAPGASTLSTLPGNTYGLLSGTSMAAPHVAGAAALLLSACPLSTANLKSVLLANVDPDASLSGKMSSGGRLSVEAALQRCLNNPPTVTVTPTHAAPGATLNVQVSNGPGNTIDWVALHASGANDQTYLQWQFLNGSQSPPSTGRTSASLQFTAPQTPGTYNVRFYANGGYTKLATSPTITVGSGQSTLTINDVSISEGDSGTSVATFTVTLSPVNPSQTVTVNYATANGSATTADNDYVAASGTLTFAPSAPTQTIGITVRGDTLVESNETFLVNLSNAINAVIGDAQGVGTIVTNEVPACTTCPAVTVQSTSVNPGGTISFQVSNGPGNTIDWVALHATGANDQTYLQWQFLSGSQSPPSTGRTSASLQFTAPQTPGTYNIRFYANGGYTKLATSETINVGVSQSTLTINDVSITEGNGGSANVTFTVTASPVNSSQTVTVNYATANGTATTADSDYVAASGTLTFPPSVGTQTFTVPVIGDTAVEPNETFLVNLSNATNATIGDTQGVATILNDEASACTACPAVTAAPTTVSPGEMINFQVSNGPGNTIDWVAFHGSGAEDRTYLQWQFLNGTQSPPSSGLTSASLQFTAPQTPGTYNIRFYANGGYTKLATSATITVGVIQSTFTINDVSITEGNGGSTNATFTVTVSPVNPSQTVTVGYATANGTATTAGSDYVAASGTLTFPPSVATQTLTVSVLGDARANRMRRSW